MMKSTQELVDIVWKSVREREGASADYVNTRMILRAVDEMVLARLEELGLFRDIAM